MSRPHCCRRVNSAPIVTLFQPLGLDKTDADPIILSLDEFEAIRLADMEGCYQEEAAMNMDVSRATFGRILGTARFKVAEALVKGKALKIMGGVVQTGGERRFKCSACSHEWGMSFSKKRPASCPQCQCEQIRKTACIHGCKNEVSERCCKRQ
ncbi:MAG: DUF134 domain-containing protein [Planctomycetota bacterium]